MHIRGQTLALWRVAFGAVCFSETSASTDKSTRTKDGQQRHHHPHLCENIRFQEAEVGCLLQNYTAQKSIRQPSLYSLPWEPEVSFRMLLLGIRTLVNLFHLSNRQSNVTMWWLVLLRNRRLWVWIFSRKLTTLCVFGKVLDTSAHHFLPHLPSPSPSFDAIGLYQ
jgi:hypothetical protein